MAEDKEKKNMQTSSEDNASLSPMQREILRRWQKKSNVGVPQALKDMLQMKFDGEVLFNEPMSKHSYVKTGGPADVFLKPNSKLAIIEAVKLAQEQGVPYYFHGMGANTLVLDGGYRGIVISLYDCLKEFKVLEKTEEHIDLWAEAGLSFNKLIHAARDLGVADLVPFVGIPGSVGGLVSMNAGTRVREIKDVLRSITVLTKDGEEKTLSREQLDFEYRDLKMTRTNLILSAVFRLTDFLDPEEINSLMKQYQQKRVDSQPLEYPNLGSMFKNPQPKYKNEVVASAGQLIEEAGLKNVRVGGARISQKHANFIINEGSATSKDILTLVNMIKDKVKQSTGIVLETEIKIIGEDA